MGYRSQVVLALSKEVTPYLLTFMAKNKEARQLIEDCDGGMDSNYDGENSWLFRWTSIKWYEGYECIDQINKFIDSLVSEDMTDYGCPEDDKTAWSENVKFVRVGEDSSDVRCEGEGFWDIYPQTSIHIGA